eukprot:SAG22_NODE_3675_length_1583_cov_0.955526_2_plen_200_part_00
MFEENEFVRHDGRAIPASEHLADRMEGSGDEEDDEEDDEPTRLAELALNGDTDTSEQPVAEGPAVGVNAGWTGPQCGTRPQLTREQTKQTPEFRAIQAAAGPGACIEVHAYLAEQGKFKARRRPPQAGGNAPAKAAIVASRANEHAHVSTGFGAPAPMIGGRSTSTSKRLGTRPIETAKLVYRVAAAVPEGCVPVPRRE